MKKMRITALCLSAAITLSTIASPVFASTEIKNVNGMGVKRNIIVVSLDKSKNKESKGDNFKFSDSKDNMKNMEWAIKAIEKLGAKGIICGYSDKSYKPQNKVTNMEALSLILKITDREEKSKNSKVPSSLSQYQKGWNLKWGWDYLSLAVSEGILLPEELKSFNPNQPIKRHELAKYLIRAIDKTEDALNNMDSKLSYKDYEAIPKASKGYVYMMNKLGIMTGNEKGQFKPNEPLTRAEIAVVIDKAGDYLDGSDVDGNEANVVFSSYDNNNNRLYVKDNGQSTYYNTVENVMVYRNNQYSDIDELVQGDVLEVVFNSSKQVIFIEVTGKVVNDDENNSEKINYTAVSYENLPAELAKQVDTLRVSKGYKAYKYENKIYLAVFMGKKSTGGYSVKINDLYKNELNNDKFRVDAVVEQSEPDRDDIVTQVITYPYTIVSFDSFDKIEKINFVDEDEDILAQRAIENLNNEVTVTGVLSYLDNSYDYIKIIKDNKLVKYEIAAEVVVYINNIEANIEELKIDMNLKLTLVNDEVIKISADYDVKELKGTIQYVNSTRKEIIVKYNNKLTTYSIGDSVGITLNAKVANLLSLKVGMEVALEFVNNKITQIDAVDVDEAFEAKVTDLRIINNELKEITLLIDNTQKKYEITENTKVIMLKAEEVKEDLAINSIVEIKLLNGELIEVEEK